MYALFPLNVSSPEPTFVSPRLPPAEPLPIEPDSVVLPSPPIVKKSVDPVAAVPEIAVALLVVNRFRL